ncbi:S8 family serine peptidase [Oxalobacteraceae bacterium OTU3REALA1]|nr:S8 family serine peptidase [Oxalobacteraceae bacterium OTU3REALA1]
MASKSKSAVGGKNKMSASLAVLLASSEAEQVTGAPNLLSVRKRVPNLAPIYHVLVRCTDPQTKSVAGIKLAKGAGEVMTALVPASKLMEFALDQKVARVSAPRRLRPLMDIAGPLVGAPEYIAQNNVSGQGVIVGVVDTGIDVNHPAFAGRVLEIWDQEIAGDGPGAGYSKLGRVLTGAAMDASADMHGHGTHVAGIASGAVAPFSGIAGAAELIIVKTNFQNSAIVEAVRWIFEEAKKLGRPCVVNLSLGGHFDGHDGEDDTSVAISDECGPGRLVVAAAGNEGGDPIHARQRVDSAKTVRFEIKVQPKRSNLSAPWFLINGWYSGKTKCEVRVISSTGAATPWQGLLDTDPAAKTTMLGSDQVVVSTPESLAPGGDRQFLVEVSGQGAVQGGLWKVEVRRKSGSASDVDVWLLSDQERYGSAEMVSPLFDTLVGSPGSGQEVVTVASYTSRNQWVDISGAPQSVGLAPDTISEFSSPGPLRGGALKPDVAAPGAMIASALSPASSVDKNDVIAQGYRVMAGTSMASPVVTGLLALFLESNPKATPAQAKAWLKKNSAVPDSPAGAHDIKWGYGLIKV